MDYLRQIEEDIRSLGLETKRYPEIKDATDRALDTIKVLRDHYISDIRKSSEKSAALSQSSDVSAPYILLLNYADASSKLTNMGLNGIQMLLNFEVVPASDVKNVLRVLSIQASSPRTEFHLKILQILLQLANSLSITKMSASFLTDATVCAFLTLSLKLARDSRGGVSVSSTSLSTTRQIISLVMDAARDSHTGSFGKEDRLMLLAKTTSDDVITGSGSVQSALLIIKDFGLFSRGLPGEWIKGVLAPQMFSLEILYNMLCDWEDLFSHASQFRATLKESICPCLRVLMRSLPEDFVANAVATRSGNGSGHPNNSSGGLVAASLFSSRVVRLARVILLRYATVSSSMLAEADLLVTLMLHVMQPNRSEQLTLINSKDGSGSMFDISHHSSGNSSSGNLISKSLGSFGSWLGQPAGSSSSSASSSSSSSSSSQQQQQQQQQQHASGSGITSGDGTGQQSIPISLMSGFVPLSTGLVPSHPVACCFEALIAFLLSLADGGIDKILAFEESNKQTAASSSSSASSSFSSSMSGTSFLVSAMVNIVMSASTVVCTGLTVEANRYEFAAACMPSLPLVTAAAAGNQGQQQQQQQQQQGDGRLVTIIEDLFSDDLHPVAGGGHYGVSRSSQMLHDHVHASSNAPMSSPGEVILLGFAVVQVVTRLMTTYALPFANASAATVPAVSSSPCCLLVERLSSSSGSYNSSNSGNTQALALLFISKSTISNLHMRMTPQSLVPSVAMESLRKSISRVCDSVYEQIEECSSAVLASTALSSLSEANAALLFSCHHSQSPILPLPSRSLSMVAELALCASLTGHVRAVSCAVASLCRSCCVAQQVGAASDATISTNNADIDKVVSGVAAAMCLVQTVHCLADFIVDWDLVVDALDQLSVTAAASNNTNLPLSRAIWRFNAYSIVMSDEGLVRLMTSLVTQSLNNLSMGIVAVQAPQLGESSSSSGSPHAWSAVASFPLMAVIEITKRNCFRVSSIWQMVTSHLRMLGSSKNPRLRAFAVWATLDIVKCSLCHLDYACRTTTAVATDGPYREYVSAMPDYIDINQPTTRSPTNHHLRYLTDSDIFGQLLPDIEGTFCPRQDVHSCPAAVVAQSNVSANARGVGQLTAFDILHSLKALSTVNYEDVRTDIIHGVLEIVQGPSGSHIVNASSGNTNVASSSGWLAIVELIASVPASMVVATAPSENDQASNSPVAHPLIPPPPSVQLAWSKSCLLSAFGVMKVIVDEFLEIMTREGSSNSNGNISVELVAALIHCLSHFTSQTADVNVSLTSVEMLWKVTDLAISNVVSFDGDVAAMKVFDLMAQALQELSMDHRPEIRNCAVNTLFSALTAHAHTPTSLLTRRDVSLRLKRTFEVTVFPMFLQTAETSRQAVLTNSEAVAPELKKGIKMTVHHSRDTTHKQWSETQTLALKGLSRLLRMVTRNLLGEVEGWYRTKVWMVALALAHSSIDNAAASAAASSSSTSTAVDNDKQSGGDGAGSSGSNEIATAAVEMLFTMLKTVSSNAPSATKRVEVHSSSSSNRSAVVKGVDATHMMLEDLAEREASRDELWQLSWLSVQETANLSTLTPLLALKVVENLSAMCEAHVPEFRYSANIQSLLETVVVLSRPRGRQQDHRTGSPQTASSQSREDHVSDLQLQRAVIGLVKAIKPVDSLSFMALISCLSELCFSFQPAQINHHDKVVILGPCAPKLRLEASAYLSCILQQSLLFYQGEGDKGQQQPQQSVPIVPRGSAVAVLDIIVKRFHYDVCEAALASRQRMLHGPLLVCEGKVLAGAFDEVATDTDNAAAGRNRSDSKQVQGSMGGFLWSFGRMLGSHSQDNAGNDAPMLTSSSPASSSLSPPRNVMHKLVHTHDRNIAAAAAASAATAATPGLNNKLGSGDNNASFAFRPLFPLTFEGDLLVLALSACLQIAELDKYDRHKASAISSSGGSGSSHLVHPLLSTFSFVQGSASLWSSFLPVLACFVGPWTQAELANAVEEDIGGDGVLLSTESTISAKSSEIQQRTAAACALLDNAFAVVTKAASISSSSPAAIHLSRSLISVCSASAVLLVHALASLPMDEDAAATTTSSSSLYGLYFESMLAKLWSHLVPLTRAASPAVAACAINATVAIVTAFGDALVTTYDGCQPCPNGHVVGTLCETFLGEFCGLEGGNGDLDTYYYHHHQNIVKGLDALDQMDVVNDHNAHVRSTMTKWLAVVSTESIEYNFQLHCTDSPGDREGLMIRNKSSAFSVPSDSNVAAIRRKSHILRAMPALMKLGNCSACAPSLRRASIKAIDGVDVASLIDSYLSLAERHQVMETENIHLREELHTFKAAATLPF